MADIQTNMNIKISEKALAKYYRACKKEGVVPSDMTRKLLRDFADDKIVYGLSQK